MKTFNLIYNRVVPPNDEKTIGGYQFKGWGAHYSNYPCSYLTAAAGVGATRQDIDLFLKRLEKNFKDFRVKENSVLTTTSSTTTKKRSENKLLETSFPHNELPVDSMKSQRNNSNIKILLKTPLRPSNSCEGVTNRGVVASASDSSTWPKHKEYSVDDSELQKRKTHLMVDKTLQNDKRKSNSNPTVNYISPPPAVEGERKLSTNAKGGKDEKMSFLIDL